MRFAIAALGFFAVFASEAFAFGPCNKRMPEGVTYLPSVAQCDGKAGIILSGRFRNSFSVVVRDCGNGDRDPCNNGLSSCGTNSSSPFKVQKTFQATIRRTLESAPIAARLHCLKERGDSEVYKLVRRMTIKRVDPVVNPSTDVFRICLPSRTVARNPVQIVSVNRPRLAGNTGFNAACRTQQYLACDLKKALDRIC